MPEWSFDLALVYLGMGYGADSTLGSAEQQVITERLMAQCAPLQPEVAREILARALQTLVAVNDPIGATLEAAERLRSVLDEAQRAGIFADLVELAGADALLVAGEKDMMTRIGECWATIPDRASNPDFRATRSTDVLDHLAFIYLLLAHGTDDELSETEVRLIHRKLREWQPALGERDVGEVLVDAAARYKSRPNEQALAEAVRAVKAALPQPQRMAALNDLVQIANADGFFLDDEEDMINALMEAWELAAFTGQAERKTGGPAKTDPPAF
jgi:uncharacterized tellurite resistance protein B-like protein